MRISLEDDISKLDMSQRSTNALKRTGITSVAALMSLSEQEIIHINNIGAKSLNEIVETIEKLKNYFANNEQAVYAENDAPDPVNEENRRIFFRFGRPYYDITLQKVFDEGKITTRAYNRLNTMGITCLSQICNKSPEFFVPIKGIGREAAMELYNAISKYSFEEAEVTEDEDFQYKKLGSEVADSYYLPFEDVAAEIEEVKKIVTDGINETFVACLYNKPLVRNALKEKIMGIVDRQLEAVSFDEIEASLPDHLLNTTIVIEAVYELEREKRVFLPVDDKVEHRYPSIIDFANTLDGKDRLIVIRKLNGETLESIGTDFDITRERVRQIFTKYLKRKGRVHEDRYRAIFEKYHFTKESFSFIFNEPEYVYHYLDSVTKGKWADIELREDIIRDDFLTEDQKQRAEGFIFRNFVDINGTRVKMTRQELSLYYSREYCRNPISVGDFISKYNLWVREQVSGEPGVIIDKLLFDTEVRTFNNAVANGMYSLCSNNKLFRYYNVNEIDADYFLKEIGFSELKNIVISSAKLFNEYPELMEEFDIRDEYELHNLLKKIAPQDGYVEFKKMPTIKFGTASEEEQLFKLMIENAPISAEELGKLYQESYGANPATAISDYTSLCAPYYSNGKYEIEENLMTEEEYTVMRACMDRDFYLINAVKDIYKKAFPNGDIGRINTYNIRAIGFMVFSGYVIRSTYKTSSEYFSHLLSGDEIINANNFEPGICGVVVYTQLLAELRSNYDLVEFEPKQYIPFSRLNEKGIEKQDFYDYCTAARSRYDFGGFFTLKSLRKGGFTNKLDDLGFENTFYESLLIGDFDHLSWIRFGNTKVFRYGGGKFSIGNFIEYLFTDDCPDSEISQTGMIDIYDLLDLLKDTFGICTPKEKVLQSIESTELYYSSITQKVYLDYNTYYEEI